MAAVYPAASAGSGGDVLNMFSIGGVGILQVVSKQVHAAAPPEPARRLRGAVPAFFGVLVLVGCAIYVFSRDRTD